MRRRIKKEGAEKMGTETIMENSVIEKIRTVHCFKEELGYAICEISIKQHEERYETPKEYMYLELSKLALNKQQELLDVIEKFEKCTSQGDMIRMGIVIEILKSMLINY